MHPDRRHHHNINKTAMTAFILVAYKPSDAITAIAASNIIALMLGIQTKVLMLNGPIEADVASGISLDGWVVLNGSNTNFEFSGWQEGLDYLRSHDLLNGGILFANDTIGRHHKSSHLIQCNFNELMHHWSSSKGAQFIGIQHFCPQPLDLEGYDVSHWICTMIFGLTSKALRKLDYKVNYIEDISYLCSDKTDGLTILSEHTSSSLKAYIEDWLLNGGWHGSKSRPLSAREQQRLQHKAGCILCEKFLIIKSRQKDIRIVGIKDIEAIPGKHGIAKRVGAQARTLKAQALHQLKSILDSRQGDIQ